MIKIKVLITFILFAYAFVFSFDILAQNPKITSGKYTWPSLSLNVADSNQKVSYTTLEQAKQNNKTFNREGKTSADCRTTTFYMHLIANAGEKINLQDVQTLPNGDFIAFGSVVTANGSGEGLVIRMTSAGSIVSQNRLRINNTLVAINAVKVWPAGNIVIAGIVANNNSAFIAELKDDLSTNWINVTALGSKPVKVALNVSDYDGYKVALAVQLSSSVVYFNFTTTGQFLWSREVQIDGLTDLVGFNFLSYGRFGLVANCVRSGKAITELLEIDANSGTILLSHISGDGLIENK